MVDISRRFGAQFRFNVSQFASWFKHFVLSKFVFATKDNFWKSPSIYVAVVYIIDKIINWISDFNKIQVDSSLIHIEFILSDNC